LRPVGYGCGSRDGVTRDPSLSNPPRTRRWSPSNSQRLSSSSDTRTPGSTPGPRRRGRVLLALGQARPSQSSPLLPVTPSRRPFPGQVRSPHTENHHRCAPAFSSRPFILGKVPRRPRPEQAPLPFDGVPDAPADENPSPEPTEIERPRRGRPRVWTSEAERKRAYRDRLAADHAEPERLRRELRTERKRVADQDRQLVRLARDLARLRADRANLATRQSDLEATIEELEARVEFWKSRAATLERRPDDERERARAATSKPPPSRAKGPRTLPDLRLQQSGTGSMPPPGRNRD
jgi:hypothetical protein